MVRDEELQRLIYYGKALGVKIVIYNKPADVAAEWVIDGSLIEVYRDPKKSKTEVILSLIHELGHQVWFIHEKSRQQDLKFDEAITRENLFQEEPDKPTTKTLRKRILEVEIAGTEWWDVIYKDTNIKIPKWKLNAAKEFDIWTYQVYYETGSFPKGKLWDDTYKAIREKHKRLK